ncbi:MAG TPA: metal-dependent transcriptional regulator [Candidatus Pullichristensenella stercoripullorum]|nr:metal-dependent transcriptional regulator [Candidatus Pullichristensenella stercoripullorum]
MRVQESRENYLEAILMLQKKHGYVRSVDVANHLNFSRPSVSVAMANLRNLGLVTTDEHGFLHLTDEGRAEAEKVLERHLLITDWLVGLGVGEETAAEDACRIEHVISQESFDCIRRHVEERLQEG